MSLKKLFSFDPKLRFFLLAVSLCSFLICAEYGITRPASNAIFVSYFGAGFFPYAWLATVPLNLLIVFLYDRVLQRFGCVKVFLGVASLVCGMHALCAALLSSFPSLSFLHYVWKDIYILLMFKQLWSLIHSTLDTSKAKFIYGILFGLGGLGSVMGSFIPGFFAVQVGSEKILFFAIPIYVLLFLLYRFAFRHSGLKEGDLKREEKKPSISPFRLVAESRFLTYLLLVVVFMQMSVAFVDYQFNAFLETHIPTKDLRTQYYGRMIGIINSLSTAFQFLGGFLVIHFLGLKRAHLMVPVFLLGNALLFLWNPLFSVISYAFVSIKAIDYSFFGVIREMLYIPLKTEEKFRAKAVIDVFAYRTARALASFLLLSLQFFTNSKPIHFVGMLSVIAFGVWAVVVFFLFKEHKQVVGNREESKTLVKTS